MNDLEQHIDQFLQERGFQLVELRRGGGRGHQQFHIKMDRPWSMPQKSEVSAQDCVRIARQLRSWLDQQAKLPSPNQMEVSSPGVERPLLRVRDYKQFAGREARIKGFGTLVEGQKTITAQILGGHTDPDRAVLRWEGQQLSLPLANIASAHLTVDFEKLLARKKS